MDAKLIEILFTGLTSGIGGGMIGGLIALFGAYWKGKSELLGQLQTQFENSPTLMALKRGTAYEEEAGKRIWEQKREMYFQILTCVNEHFNALMLLQGHREGVWGGARREGINLSLVSPTPNQIDDLMRAYIESHRKLSNALRIAYVFVNPIAFPLLTECSQSGYFGKAFGKLDPKRGYFDRTEQEQIEIQELGAQEMTFLGNWMYRVVVCARQDLHVGPVAGTPPNQ